MTKFSGRLVLVVGPSGAGKDSIIDGARAWFSEDAGIVFQRRVITRTVTAGTEDHDTLTVDGFMAADRRGDFALSWQAHGLWYGVPIAVEQEMAAGHTVIVNVSRTVIDTTSARYKDTQTISITASPETIAKRLAARGRETAEEIRSRLERTVDVPLSGTNRWVLENNGTLQDAIDRFVEIVEIVRAGCPSAGR